MLEAADDWTLRFVFRRVFLIESILRFPGPTGGQIAVAAHESPSLPNEVPNLSTVPVIPPSASTGAHAALSRANSRRPHHPHARNQPLQLTN